MWIYHYIINYIIHYLYSKVLKYDPKNPNWEERDYFILIDIAEKLDIPLPKNYDQQTRWMKNQLQEIAVKLRREKTTYNYLFTEKETKEERDNLIRQFVNQLFGIDIN